MPDPETAGSPQSQPEGKHGSRPQLTGDPLASLAKTNSPRRLLKQVADRVASIESVKLRQDLEVCSVVLAGLRFQKEFINQFFREDVMRESVIYQDILQQGQHAEALSLSTKLISKRLGWIEASTQARVQELSLPQLESLIEAILDLSSEADLIQWLNQTQ